VFPSVYDSDHYSTKTENVKWKMNKIENNFSLKDNWEHHLVGDRYVYAIQAYSKWIKIIERNGGKELVMIPIEELRDLISEYDKFNKDI